MDRYRIFGSSLDFKCASSATVAQVRGPYRSLFAVPAFRRLMPAFALSDLGDGMTVVAVAWLALALAPPGARGTLAGLAVAAYVLPGALGAIVLGRRMRNVPAVRLVTADAALRAVTLGAIPVAHLAGALTPAAYVGLLGASSLLHAWGKAGKHALFAPLLPADQRLAANSLLSTSLWAATIAGPALAGLLVSVMSPAWIIGLDAATFAALAVQAGRTRLPAVSAPAAAGGRAVLLRQPELLGLLVMTWLFNLAFGPVEVALPLFVADELHAGPGVLGGYWSVFGIGAVAGALALGFARRLPLWPAMIAIVAGHGLGMLPFAFTGSALPSLLGFALAGLIYGPYSALSFTLLQERAPASALTAVLAARAAVLLTAAPLGALCGGLALNRVGAPVVLVGSGAAMLAIAAACAIVRRLVPARCGQPPGNGCLPDL
jgi:predicted MFS family arabinose efflux permease